MEHDVTLDPDQRARLQTLEALVRRWNPTINLVSSRDIPMLWIRHIVDSVQLARLIRPEWRHGIDLGSGAGFPGLVLSIVTGIPFDLVEADQRKAAFLREAARETGAAVQVHASRIDRTDLAPSPLVTARALAELPALLRSASRFVAPGGTCLFPKGKSAARELTEARREWQMQVELHHSLTDPSATILELSAIRYVGPGDRA